MKHLFRPIVLTGLLLAPGALFAAPNSLPTVTVTAGRYQETLAPEVTSSFMRIATEKIRNPHYQSEIETPFFCATIKDFCQFTTSVRANGHTQITVTKDLDQEHIKQYISDLEAKVTLPAEDAVFAGDASGKVYVKTPEKLGQELDTTKALAIFIDTLENATSDQVTVSLPVNTSNPKFTSKDLTSLGFTELLGEGHSNFAGSPKNRIYNIRRGLQDYQGLIVPAGAEFSFVDHLSPVDGEHGFLPELVIKENKTTPEFGGGICQVSSTLFRAAIYSGLKITERHNHSYPVRYYLPYGMDATIYEPRPDFKFLNNTPGPILILSEVVGTELTFRFFGTRDGRSVSVDGPHILERGDDGSMKTIFTQIVKDKDGNEASRQSFPSNYKSPKLFPHPGEEEKILTSKPGDWSAKQWKQYQQTH
jgi:vancomycin resistance protein YoaR